MRTGFRRALIAIAAVAVAAALWTQIPPAVESDRGLSGTPDRRRPAGPERNLAGRQHGELRPPGPSRTTGIGADSGAAAPGPGTRPGHTRRSSRTAGACTRRGRRGSGRRRRRGGQRDPLPAMGGGEEEGERRTLAGARSGNQVLHARRASRDVHAVSVPDPAGDGQDSDRLRIRGGDAHDSYGQGRETVPARRGWAGRAAAGKARRSSSTSPISTTRRGSTGPEISTATRCTSSSGILRQSVPPHVRGHHRRPEGVHPAVEDAACRSIGESNRTSRSSNTSAWSSSRS